MDHHRRATVGSRVAPENDRRARRVIHLSPPTDQRYCLSRSQHGSRVRDTEGVMSFDPNAPAQPGSGIFGLPHSETEALVVLVPVPWEATTSYGGGAADGPRAILHASMQVDLFDLDVDRPYQHGIHMVDPVPDVV